MPDILLTNDDGYNSIGFYPLLKELSKDFEVIAVAPTEQKSWQGKSITPNKEIFVKQVKVENIVIYTLNGTPADCVQIGLYDIAKKRPKFVVSGINNGVNVGHGRILSSGTAGAGMEAVIDGLKAFSTSLYFPPELLKSINFYDPHNYHIYNIPAKITAKIVKILFHKQIQNDIDLISINMLNTVTLQDEFEITALDRQPYGKLFHKKGESFWHINPSVNFDTGNTGTDIHALNNNKISITPISLELTSHSSKESLNNLLGNEW